MQSLLCILGKFGQRTNLAKVKFCFEEHEFWALITGDQYVIADVVFHGDTCAQVEYSEAADFICPGANTNVVIAAFTTAFARLKLYESLKQLDHRVLYFDTGTNCSTMCLTAFIRL